MQLNVLARVDREVAIREVTIRAHTQRGAVLSLGVRPWCRRRIDVFKLFTKVRSSEPSEKRFNRTSAGKIGCIPCIESTSRPKSGLVLGAVVGRSRGGANVGCSSQWSYTALSKALRKSATFSPFTTPQYLTGMAELLSCISRQALPNSACLTGS